MQSWQQQQHHQNQAGRSIFMSSVVGLSNVIAVVVAFFATPVAYDRTVGYARRVMPEGTWGAPELVARLSREDLDDGAVQGGSFDKTYFGVNWWATRRWKLGLGWGHTLLDRFDSTGTTDSLQLRLQWVY